MSENPILMTQAQYARHRNKSPQYIAKLVPVLGATAQISEAYLQPVLEAMLAQFPFRIRGFIPITVASSLTAQWKNC